MNALLAESDYLFIYPLLDNPNYTYNIKDCPMVWRWMLLVDALVGLLVVLALVMRILFFVLGKAAIRWNVFLNFYLHAVPYERTVVVFSWALTAFTTHQTVLVYIIGQDVGDIVWSSMRTIFAVVTVFSVKEVVYNISELWTFRNIQEQLQLHAKVEHMLLEFEADISGVKKFKFEPRSLLLPVFAIQRRVGVISRSKSILLHDMDERIEKHGESPSDAALQVTKGKIFNNRAFITSDDIEILFGQPAEPQVLMHFDKDNDGKISERDFAETILDLWRERNYILNWAKGRRLLLDVSQKLLTFVSWVVELFLILTLFVQQFVDIQWNTLLVSIGTALVTLGFAYARTLQDMLDSMYMIFFLKPFQVGDVITLNNGEQLIVDSVGFMSTYFISVSTGVGVYLKNSSLVAGMLSNLNRGDKVTLKIPFNLLPNITGERISELRRKLKQYMRNQPDVYSKHPKVTLTVDKLDPSQRLFEMLLTVRFTKWWRYQDEEWKGARSKLLIALNQFITEMEIGITPPIQPHPPPMPSSTTATL